MCARKEQFMLFDLFKAFDKFERSHKSDIFYPKRFIIFFICAHNIMSYHLKKYHNLVRYLGRLLKTDPEFEVWIYKIIKFKKKISWKTFWLITFTSSCIILMNQYWPESVSWFESRLPYAWKYYPNTLDPYS